MNKALLIALLFVGLYISYSTCYKSFAGSNLYYAAGLYQNEAQYLLSNLQKAGIKVLRVWLDGQGSPTKGTNIRSFPSLEPYNVGQYDDTVLGLYDDFMIMARQYGIKLLISCHSFNALQAGDVYGKRWGTGYFYEKADAQAAFDNRLRHILSHVNQKLGKPWSQLSDYIFAFEAENEAMIGNGQSYIQAHQYWQCDRAQTLKQALNGNTGILITTGGESWVDESMMPDWFSCPYLDVLAMHGYGVGDFNTGKLQAYVNKGVSSGKKILFEEWGACYYNTENNNCQQGGVLNPSTRDYNIRTWANTISSAGLPWMYWQILPNNDPHQGWDYEIGINDANWNTFAQVANGTGNYETPFNYWPWLIQ